MSTCIECLEPVSRPAARGPGASLRTAPAAPRIRRVAPAAAPAVVRPAPSPAAAPAVSAPAVARHSAGAYDGVLVAPTVVPAHSSGDLLGLPDLSWLRLGIGRLWGWAVAELRGAADVDGRLRARRDEDSAAMVRAGVVPTRYL